MGLADVMALSLGEWTATMSVWSKAHGHSKPSAPSEEEFDLAVMQARGVA